MKTDIYDFAELANVSVATVSRAFSGKGRISPKTRQRILALARQINYTPNIHARRLANASTQLIGLFFAGVNAAFDYFTMELSQAIARAASVKGYSTQLELPDPERNCLERMNELVDGKAVDALIIIGGNIIGGSYFSIERDLRRPVDSFPCVVIHTEAPPQGSRVCAVYIDNKQGIYEAVSSMTASGISRIGMIRGLGDCLKVDLFLEALRTNGLNIDQGWILEGGGTFEGAAKAAGNLLSAGVEAIFCCTDIMALATVQTAVALGRKVPDDFVVIGMDDLSFSRFTTPALSTVVVPISELAESAVATVVDLIKRKPLSRGIGSAALYEEPVVNRIETHFVKRQSSR